MVFDMGTNNNLHNAFDNAFYIVDNTCSFGFNNWIEASHDDKAAENRNCEVSFVMERNYMAVKKLLIENRELPDILANTLLEKTTMLATSIIGAFLVGIFLFLIIK